MQKCGATRTAVGTKREHVQQQAVESWVVVVAIALSLVHELIAIAHCHTV